ncbi:M28 family peptidase [Streptomyces sp. SID13031]|uniref:M28 family peptidase n=1 Tax=Streptomyces sp. SID13031 TaxID=2706046 RepID=UPI0013CC6A34|nr:M28 family peptidase [Streptomyces sp. SID13031]NEA32496.1 M28 family peptidase [Streptomyces sp. SID13031]
MEAADKLLIEEWNEAGWVTSAHPFHLEQADGIQDFDTFAPASYEGLDGVNLVAVKKGCTDEAILIGAHHDTVRDSPGACDNGAGLAALTEIARLLAHVPLRKTVILAAFDLEEIGVLGSPQLLPWLTTHYQVDSAVILESIGFVDDRPSTQSIPSGFGLLFPRQTLRIRLRRRRADWTAAIYRGSARPVVETLRREIRAIAGPNSVLTLRDPLDRPLVGKLLRRLLPSLKNLTRSDHAAFWAAGIPAVQLTDTANFRGSHYHRETDTVDTIDFEHLRRITAAVAATVVTLAVEVPS